MYSSKEAKEGRRKQLRLQIKYPARLYVDGRFIRSNFLEWFRILNQSRVEGFKPDTAKTEFRSMEIPTAEPQRPLHYSTHDRQELSRVSSSRDTSVQRDTGHSLWLSQHHDDWNERLTPERSQVKTTDVRTSPVATQLSPSLLDSSVQNVNIDKRTNGQVPDYVSRESSHSNDSRATAKNNQGK